MKSRNTFFYSYVFIELRGKMPERFLTICKARNIPLYDVYCTVSEHRSVYTARMRLADYYRIRSIARKTGCFPIIKKRLGLPFLLKKYKARIVFLSGGLYFFWLIYLLSTFLWSITVSGGFLHTQEELKGYLKEKNIMCGMRCSEIDCDRLEKQIRLDYPDIGWVSAELKGTKLILQISETNQPGIGKISETESNLCATADGIVVSILCTLGTPLVKEGDVVKKGDVLISGIVPVIGDNETQVNTHLVAAQGNILLQSVKQYEYRFSEKKHQKQSTGNEKKGISFYWKNNKLFSVIPSHNYEKYDIIQKDVSFFWNEFFHFPFLIKKLELCEYTEFETEYMSEEIDQITRTALEQYTEYLKNNGTEVIGTAVTTTVRDGFIISEGKLIIQSAAWERVPIMEE